MYHLFENAANFCEETFGCEVFEENNVVVGFICPSCGELIYSEDWTDADTENWMICPICGEPFGEDE